MVESPSKYYMKGRPPKKIFSIEKQRLILDQIKKYVHTNLPPNTKLYRKRIFGSMAKKTFGKYDKKFKGREFSDVDILFVVDDNFKPLKKWKVEFEYIKKVWIVYNVAVVPVKTEKGIIPVEIQYIILTKTFAKEAKTKLLAEKWGIPLKKFFTKNKFISL